jgi:hypothetical protein
MTEENPYLTAQMQFKEEVGPTDERLIHEVIQVCKRAENHGDFAVLTARQAESISEFFTWLGWEDLAVSTPQREHPVMFLEDDEYDIEHDIRTEEDE